MFNKYLDKDVENIITYNLLFLFIIAFYHMTYYDNVSRIECINNFYHVNSSISLNSAPSITAMNLNESVNTLMNVSLYDSGDVSIDSKRYFNLADTMRSKNHFIKLADVLIYFLVIPIMNIIYGIWCLKNQKLLLPEFLKRKLYKSDLQIVLGV
jgi:hypothetical protein